MNTFEVQKQSILFRLICTVNTMVYESGTHLILGPNRGHCEACLR